MRQTEVMASRNPALNDKVFEKEIRSSRGEGGFSPAWGAPADELPPPGLGRTSTLPPPPGAAYGPPPTGGPVTRAGGPDAMRLGGTLSASAVLLLILVTAGWFGWQAVHVVSTVNEFGQVTKTTQIPGWLMISWVAGLGLAILTILRPKLARVTAPAYAVAEGLLVGGISRFYEVRYSGIVLQAVGLTIGVFVMMLVLYATRTIRVTDKLRTGIIAATGAVALVYLASLVLRIFGADVPFIHEAGPAGIGFSLIVVGIASFNLLLDFDFIERGVKAGAPRYMEWYGAFGLIVTLVWLYLELLRLLSKLRQR